MPHTSHRTRPPRHPTHQRHTTDDDGWTHVSRAPSSRAAAQALAKASLAPDRPYTADPSLTPARLAAEYASCLARWKASPARADVVRFLQRSKGKVERAVCVGLGAVGRSEGRGRTVWQLALLRDCVDQVACTASVPIYVRDPALVAGDEAFLASLGVTVLQTDAAALAHVVSGSFAFLPFLEKTAERAYLARAAECEVYVSTRASEAAEHFRTYAGGEAEVHDALRGAEKLAQTHDELRVGEVEGDGQALMGLWVYRRKATEAESVDA